MLHCLFQPPEESRRCSGVEVQWGEGWGHLPWPPGLSPAPVLLSPLSPTHSLLLSPVSTYRYPLSSPSLAPHSLLLLGVPTMGGRALPFVATWGILWGQGEHKTPAPLDWEGTQAGSTLAPSRVENGDLTRTPFLPTPGTAAIHLEKCQLQGGQWCRCGGMDPLSHRTNPEPVPSAGRGCRGSRTCCWDHPVLQAAGPGHHLLPPAPSARPLPPSCCPPRPGPDPDAGIAAAKLRKQSEPFKAEGGSPGGAGFWRQLRRGTPRAVLGERQGRGGGQEGGLAAVRRQGQKVPVGCWGSLLYSTSCCCWVASLTTCRERSMVTCYAMTAPEPQAWGQVPYSVPCASLSPPGAALHAPLRHGFQWF